MTTYRWQDPTPPAAASITQRRERRALLRGLRDWKALSSMRMKLSSLMKSRCACGKPEEIAKAVVDEIKRSERRALAMRISELDG